MLLTRVFVNGKSYADLPAVEQARFAKDTAERIMETVADKLSLEMKKKGKLTNGQT